MMFHGDPTAKQLNFQTGAEVSRRSALSTSLLVQLSPLIHYQDEWGGAPLMAQGNEK